MPSLPSINYASQRSISFQLNTFQRNVNTVKKYEDVLDPVGAPRPLIIVPESPELCACSCFQFVVTVHWWYCREWVFWRWNKWNLKEMLKSAKLLIFIQNTITISRRNEAPWAGRRRTCGRINRSSVLAFFSFFSFFSFLLLTEHWSQHHQQ